MSTSVCCDHCNCRDGERQGHDEPCSGACLVCGQCPRRFEGGVCQRCKSRMRTDLRDIVDLYALVSREIAKGAGGDGRSTEYDLGVRISALDFAAGNDILPELEAWDRDWRAFFGHAPYGVASALNSNLRGQHIGGTLTWVVAYLLTQLDQACDMHPAIGDFAHEIRTLHRNAQSATRSLPRSRWSVTCPTDIRNGLCDNRLSGAGVDLEDHLYCNRCGTDWRVGRLLAVVASSKESETWLTADDVLLLMGIAPRTLRDWAKKALVRRSGGMYELASIREAVALGRRAG